MVDSFTANKNLVQPLVGGDAGLWGGILNSGVMEQLDLILGATQPISISSADVILSTTQWNNVAFNLTGTLTGNHNLILPYVTGTTTVAVGGLFVVENNTAGAFVVNVLTQAGTTGVSVPQGVRTFLYSDTINVWNADDAKLQLIPKSGNPNGSVAGVAGTVNNPPSAVWDYTNSVLYFCTQNGTAASAVWTNVVASGSPLPVLQGYLTPVSNTPIITADSIGATIIYYTPFHGSWSAVHNGTNIIAFQFSQMPLTLSASQAALNIYDVFQVYNGGTPVIGTGPSWLGGSGGSITAGSCARGTGVGSTAINRGSTGLWTNTNSMSLIYNTGGGNNTITVPAGQGIYLGSIYIDNSAGQLSCYRSYGQSRKWGIWNVENQEPIELQVGDATSSWSDTAGTWHPANTNSANSGTVFCGLPITQFEFEYYQVVAAATQEIVKNAVGFNSTSSPSGVQGYYNNPGAGGPGGSMVSKYVVPPSSLGINVATQLLFGQGAGATLNGGASQMCMYASWNG